MNLRVFFLCSLAPKVCQERVNMCTCKVFNYNIFAVSLSGTLNQTAVQASLKCLHSCLFLTLSCSTGQTRTSQIFPRHLNWELILPVQKNCMKICKINTETIKTIFLTELLNARLLKMHHICMFIFSFSSVVE